MLSVIGPAGGCTPCGVFFAYREWVSFCLIYRGRCPIVLVLVCRECDFVWAVVTIRHSDPQTFCFEGIEIHVLEVVHLLVSTMSYVPPISGRYPGVGLACSSDSISCQSEPEDRKPWVGAPAEADALCQVFPGPEQWLLRDVLAYYRGAPLRQGDWLTNVECTSGTGK